MLRTVRVRSDLTWPLKAARFVEEALCAVSNEFELILSFPDVQSHIVDAPLGAGPESILPVVVMDSGLARFARAPE